MAFDRVVNIFNSIRKYNPIKQIRGNGHLHNQTKTIFNPYTDQSNLTSRAYSCDIAGLKMILNVNQSNYVSQNGDIAGLRVITLSQHQIAFPEDEGLTISPGYSAYVGLKMVT